VDSKIKYDDDDDDDDDDDVDDGRAHGWVSGAKSP